MNAEVTGRIAGDYGVDVVLEIEEVEETIRRADEFLRAARAHLPSGLAER